MEIRLMLPADEDDIAGSPPPFDHAVDLDATRRLLESNVHHLFIAYEADAAVGFITGVEMTHSDKGTEMFLYELEVAADYRRRGIGTALIAALAELATKHDCSGMWVLTDDDNVAAQATYQGAGATHSGRETMLSWDFRES